MSLFGLFEQIDESPIGCSKGHTHTKHPYNVNQPGCNKCIKSYLKRIILHYNCQNKAKPISQQLLK